MAGVPGYLQQTIKMGSKKSPLYEKTAMTIAKAIGFNVDNIEGLQLPSRFSEKNFQIICKQSITDDDILIRINKNDTEKRKKEALREKLRWKFTRISAGEEIFLETVFDV